MPKSNWVWWIGVCCSIAVSASEAPPDNHASPEVTLANEEMLEFPVRLSARDVKIPAPLISKIESDYREFLSNQIRMNSTGLKRIMLHMSVELLRDHPGAISENRRILTPLGGGVIDLADHVTAVRGAFRLKIKAHHKEQDVLSGSRIFYISRARARKLGREEYGAGCDKFMEVSKYFKEKMRGKGFEVFSGEQRYVSTLAGTFLLVKFEPEHLLVGSITFEDSRYPELICE